MQPPNLADYNFTIHYRPGKVNKDADCLSRMPLDIEKYVDLCSEKTSLNIFQEMVENIDVYESSPQHIHPETLVSVARINLLEKNSQHIQMKENKEMDP